MSHGRGLSLRIISAYAAPAFVLSLAAIPAYVLLPTFYADTMGLGLSATGFALLVARLFDVAVDLPVGHLADRPQWGSLRYKPLIVIGAVIAAVGLYRVFVPDEGVGALYLVLWTSCLYLGWTLIQLPYLAWGAVLASGYRARAAITGWREAFGLVGILAAASAPAISASQGLATPTGYHYFALAVIGIGALALLGLLVWVPEPQYKVVRTRPRFRSLLRNGLFLRLLSAWFVNGLANGFPAVLFPLFATYVLEADQLETGVLLACYFLSGVLCAPIWVALVGKIDKHRLWCLAMTIACGVFSVVPFLGPGDIVPFLIICLVSGATLGADLALPPAMQADVIDWDRYRFRAHRGGVLFAFWSMATKLALALAVGIAFPMLEALGFESKPDNAPSALLALAMIYSTVPVVLKLSAIVTIWSFPLGQRGHKAVQRRLTFG